MLRLKPESEVRLRLPDRHQVLDNDAWDQAKARLQAELVRRLEELKLQEWVEAAGGLKCKYVYQCPPKHLEVLEHLGSYGDIEYVKVPALQNWCEEQQERNLLIFPPGRYQFYIHGLSMFDQSQTGFKMDGSLHLQFQLMSQFHGRVFTIPGKWPIHAGKSPWAQRLVKRVDVEETQLDAHFLVFTLMDGTEIRELIEEPYMTEWNHDTREDCFYVPEGYKGGVPAWMDGAIRYATCDDDNSSERAERIVEEVYQTFERCLGQYNPAHYVRGYVADLAYRSGIDHWVREVEETSEEIIVRFKRPEAK